MITHVNERKINMLKTQSKDSMISDAEWEVMRIIWTIGNTRTSQVIEELQPKMGWTESTIKTLLHRLVQKGLLKTKKDGRRFIYTATVSQTEMMYTAASDLLSRLCDMHKGKVILKLLQDSPISQSDLTEMQEEIKEKKKTAPEIVPCNCLKGDGHIC